MTSEIIKERVRTWHKHGYAPQYIASTLKLPVDEVKAIIDNPPEPKPAKPAKGYGTEFLEPLFK
ncbi:RNA polymerase subunit sigma [Bifidobacterium olomucense]|uniref:Uncharacterized protein n=1 Tax=Bifidobacterium olomucense TaxID=2675324 RepID=A0A7Y0EZK2_9BIFI|nr:RNA polymerase subunit sigma [Bifidobacterium sp. DSM 109959]NMM99282.1 hypothetical protein [Bifidobacterium sp. DSM 109959]